MGLGLREFVLSTVVAVGVTACKTDNPQPTTPEIVTSAPVPLVEKIVTPPPLTDKERVELLRDKVIVAAGRCTDIFRHGTRHPDDNGKEPIVFQLITPASGTGESTRENCAAYRSTNPNDTVAFTPTSDGKLRVEKGFSWKKFVGETDSDSVSTVLYILDDVPYEEAAPKTTATVENVRLSAGLGWKDGIVDIGNLVYVPKIRCEGNPPTSVDAFSFEVGLDGTAGRSLDLSCKTICPTVDTLDQTIQAVYEESRAAIKRTQTKK